MQRAATIDQNLPRINRAVADPSFMTVGRSTQKLLDHASGLDNAQPTGFLFQYISEQQQSIMVARKRRNHPTTPSGAEAVLLDRQNMLTAQTCDTLDRRHKPASVVTILVQIEDMDGVVSLIQRVLREPTRTHQARTQRTNEHIRPETITTPES